MLPSADICWNPPVSSNFEVGRFPFSDYWTSGVIRMSSQYESVKVGIIFAQEELNGLPLVQFECPRHRKPPVSSNFEVARQSINLGNLACAGAPGYWVNIQTAFRHVIRRQ